MISRLLAIFRGIGSKPTGHVVFKSLDGTVLATYTDEAALRWNLVNDNIRLRADMQDLKEAIDYDAAHGATVGPSLHEWADGAAPGTYGGGRKP